MDLKKLLSEYYDVQTCLRSQVDEFLNMTRKLLQVIDSNDNKEDMKVHMLCLLLRETISESISKINQSTKDTIQKNTKEE